VTPDLRLRVKNSEFRIPVRPQHFRDQVLVRISYDPLDARQFSDFSRSALGVASGDHNSALRIRAVDAADDLAHFGVGRRGHRARIEDGDLAILSA
jgi:hypothetical protein